MTKLDGQVAIITGGARGIGEGASEVFCQAGAKVVIWDVLDGQFTAARIAKKGGEIFFQKVDITDRTNENLQIHVYVAATIRLGPSFPFCLVGGPKGSCWDEEQTARRHVPKRMKSSAPADRSHKHVQPKWMKTRRLRKGPGRT